MFGQFLSKFEQMKYLLSTLLFSLMLFSTSNLSAQECENIFYTTVTQEGLHQTETVKQLLSSKDRWFYGIQFVKNTNGNFAKLYNVEGINLKKDDEITFIDTNGKKVKLAFTNTEVIKNLDGNAYHENYIKLNSKNLNWLSSQNIRTVSVKSADTNELREFEVNADRQQGFLNKAKCFVNSYN